MTGQTQPVAVPVRPVRSWARQHYLCLLIFTAASQTQAGPSFSAALEASWQSTPEQQALETAQSLQQQRRPDWLVETPALAIDYTQGDHAAAISEEWQVSLNATLSKPGQYQTRSQLSQTAAQLITSERNYQRWLWSGRLQSWWWQRQQLSLQQQRNHNRLTAMTQQLDWLQLLVSQGERPAADRLPLQQALQQLKASQLTLQGQQQDLTLQFRQWTGQDQLPDDWHFVPVTAQPLEQHPLLRFQVEQRQQALLNQTLSRQQALTPTVSLGIKHLAAINDTPGSELLMLGISLPLGNAGYQNQRTQLSTLVQQQRAERDVRQQLQRQQQVLASQLPQLAVRVEELAQLSDDASQQYDAQYQAWRQGQLSGLEWLQVQNSIWQLQQQADDARLAYQQAISDWNQLQGEIPQ
ncbi:TolC family protein [Candidatus Thalassolituus haligoni]|uniref:TolC family protein n=1 Tax=Candidatus Thalassolituus haligoni TaxID=3100113 RepID=UPI003518C88F